MFKFSRYFFIVFLVITVFPLAFMFCWNHYQMKQFAHRHEENVLEIGFRQLETLSKDYLTRRENLIKRTIDNLSGENISLKQYKNILGADQVYLTNSDQIINKKPALDIPENLDKSIIKYYDLRYNSKIKKPEIISIFIAPLHNYTSKRLVVIYKVPLERLYPYGPFDLEVYSGEKIDPDSLLADIEDPFLPQTHKHLSNNSNFILIDSEFKNHLKKVHYNIKEFKILKLKNYEGKLIASLLLRRGHMPMHPPIRQNEEVLGLVILLTGVLSSLIAGFYIKKNFINPFLILAKASKKIQDGDLSFRLASDVKHQEVIETIKRFNAMIDELKEKNELRNSFITNLTHDLRTPLIAQERAIELIVKEFESLGLDKQLQLAKGIDKNNKHLLRMVNLILESYRFESDEINLIISNVDMHELIEQCFGQLDFMASEKNIQMINNISSEFPRIRADLNSLKRVFLNLIANAIENTSKGQRIEISGYAYNDYIKLIVEDNGAGVSPEDIPLLFNRYYTGKSDERKIGSGLGLYVCRKLIEMHEGKIEVESEKNQYTRFIITLPLKS